MPEAQGIRSMTDYKCQDCNWKEKRNATNVDEKTMAFGSHSISSSMKNILEIFFWLNLKTVEAEIID